MRIVLTGSAAGGHLVPLEPIIEALRTVHKEQLPQLPVWLDRTKLSLYFLGLLDETGRELFRRLDVKVIALPSGKVRRYPSWATLPDLLVRLPWGVLLALFHMWRIMPDVVISKGGFGSVPVVLAALFYRIPFLLHESDAVSGLANRLMSAWASAVTVGYAMTRQSIRFYREKAIITGTPVRSDLAIMGKDEAKKSFGFAPALPVLLVMGGSQGAQQINDILLQVLPALLPDMGVIHLTGRNNFAAVKAAADEVLAKVAHRRRYQPFDYLTDRMGAALSAAEVVVTRAGATALAEVAHLRKATIIVPLDSAAQDHQRLNAAVFEMAQAARVIDPANLGRAIFLQNIRDVMNDADIRETLENNIATLDRPRAARDIAQLTFKLAQGFAPRQPKQ